MRDLIEFFDPPITIGWNVTPTAALEHLQGKGLKVTFSYADLSAEEQAAAFTIAKMADMDLLATVKESLEASLAQGKDFKAWAKEIGPLLEAKGWAGTAPHRLATIFRTNMATAYSVGEWERIADQAETAPYLLYDAVDDFRTRPLHAAWDGTVLPVNHPWWRSHMPPNGFNCRCGVIQLSADEVEELGLKVSANPRVKLVDWVNPRTGKTEKIPEGIDPGFNHNPGQARLEYLAKLAAEKIAALPPEAAKAAAAGMQATEALVSEMAAKVIATASAAGSRLSAASKAIERGARVQIQQALDAGTPYLAAALRELDSSMPASERLAVAKERAARAEQSALLRQYRDDAVSGRRPGSKAKAAFDALPESAQAAIAAEIAASAASAAAATELRAIANGERGERAKDALAGIDGDDLTPQQVLAVLRAVLKTQGV